MTMTQPKYRCFDCKLKYKNDKIKMNKQFEFMACDYYAQKPRHGYKPDYNNKGNPSILYYNCVGNYYDGYYATQINNYQSYKEGVMPFSGGLYEQPAKIVECMDLVHNLISENNQERERQEKLRNNRRGK